MLVHEVYRPQTVTCEAKAPLSNVARIMTEAQVGALAVTDGNIIVGLISERDVVRAVAEGADPARVRAATFATPHLQTASLQEETAQVGRRMLDAGVRHLPVVQDHTVVGMISMRDLIAVEAWL